MHEQHAASSHRDLLRSRVGFPTYLDASGRADLDTLLSALRQRSDIALVIVSHDRDLPEGLVDRLVELEAGRIRRDEPLENAIPDSRHAPVIASPLAAANASPAREVATASPRGPNR